MIQVRVPASTSNLGPGFDCLGLAVELALAVEARLVPGTTAHHVECAGPADLSQDATNLVHSGLRQALAGSTAEAAGLELRVWSEIPVARGLGSSAASTVAGLVAGALLASGEAPKPESLLVQAAALEGHPDNAAPAIYGGFVASAPDGDRIHVQRLLFPADLDLVFVVPEARLRTVDARRALPTSVSRGDAVFELQRLALLLGALSQGPLVDLRAALRDRLHQAHRLALVPGLAAALEALDADPGALGAAVSGSGPALLAFVHKPAPTCGEAAIRALTAAGTNATRLRTRVATTGAVWRRRDTDPWTPIAAAPEPPLRQRT